MLLEKVSNGTSKAHKRNPPESFKALTQIGLYQTENRLKIKSLINLYFDGAPTDEQMRHCMSYTAVASYHWFLWALYKEATGDPVGEWLYLWYRSMKTFGSYALSLYER